MPLFPGTRLGPYEILAPLGAGGMGEVYRAKDTKVDREVAAKVLPPAYAQHPERLARFEHEAKVLASLNHTNIATIYDVEESPAGKALVMELVQGQTLKGPVSVDTALKYAAQIASALEAAPEKGITHRDLRPANIMVTPNGTIKVLDFGLAAATQPSRDDGEIGTNMATLTMSPTQAGRTKHVAASALYVAIGTFAQNAPGPIRTVLTRHDCGLAIGYVEQGTFILEYEEERRPSVNRASRLSWRPAKCMKASTKGAYQSRRLRPLWSRGVRL